MPSASVHDHQAEPPWSTASALDALRDAGLRPTIARIAIFQVMQAVSPRALSSDDVFRELIQRGSKTSIGTVYRTMHELQAKGLLQKDADSSAPALYRVRQIELESTRRVRLIRREDGHIVDLHDENLYTALLHAAKRAGVDLSGQQLNIKFDAVPPPTAATPNRMWHRRPRLV